MRKYMRHRIRNILSSVLSERRSHDTEYQYADIELEKLKDRDDIYIQFTDTEKFGINPMTHKQYQTPAGIYTYPLKQIWDKKRKHRNNKTSFGSTRKYINVIQIDRDITLDVKEYTTAMLHEDVDALWQYVNDKYGLRYGETEMKRAFQDAMRYSKRYSIMSDLFSFCLLLIKAIIIDSPESFGGSQAWIWNGMLRYLGYTVITDRYGTGTIHANEPIQALILDPREVTLLMRLNNKMRIPKGKDINTMTPEEQIQIINRHGWDTVRSIDNPSLEVEKHMIDLSPSAVDPEWFPHGISAQAKKYMRIKYPNMMDYIDSLEIRK